VTIQLDLAHCNAVSYADRHSRTQQSRNSPPPTKSVADVTSLQRRPVRLLSVWLRRCDKNDATRPGGQAGPARPGRSARHQIQIITVDEVFFKYVLLIYLLEKNSMVLNLDFINFHFIFKLLVL
jgi:hypothetical protein